jgi:hypothetical protein
MLSLKRPVVVPASGGCSLRAVVLKLVHLPFSSREQGLVIIHDSNIELGIRVIETTE